MAILKIARMGHPILKCRAAPIEDPTAPAVRQLAADMLETLQDAEGAGLAAPQVHVPLRLVLFHVPAERAAAEGDDAATGGQALTVLVNPEVEALDDALVDGLEACLSVPGLAGIVPRHRRIRYRWLDLDGASHEAEAEGFHARVVQHECDHLDGVLYPMRMRDLSTLTFTTELGRARDEGPPAADDAEGGQ